MYLHINQTGLKKDSICLCEQPMSISKDNLLSFVTRLKEEHMRKVDDGLRCQLCL
ncbi:MAG: type II toxin-antitoxin system PemK/MazF family toxin [Clostridia bacterium]|nr:type II toxin-antitoxin system PemK/MazF family toxin [Clostridia bacterium]